MRKPPTALPTLALLGAFVLAPASMAQMRGGASSGFAHNVGFSFRGLPSNRGFGPGVVFVGDGFYADYPVAPVILPAQFVNTPPAPANPVPEITAEPLLIELQGDRYVRFGGKPSDYSAAQASKNAQTRPELPPTVLIFRDGHREQVPGYAIVGATLYANEDYWQSGRWTKNIELSALNIPATIQANRDNGIKFTLPSAPNEVITRP
jgi:hypothetical protein